MTTPTEGRTPAGDPDPSEVLTLAEAATVAGLAPVTLRLQVDHGRLAGRKSGGTWLVTRRALHEYLASRIKNAGQVAADYRPPRGMKPLPTPPTKETNR